MIDLEEIDLSAAPGTSARKIRAGKKNVAKILARGQGIPSWKRSLASARGKKTRSWLGLKVISVEERFVEQHGRPICPTATAEGASVNLQFFSIEPATRLRVTLRLGS